MKLFQFLGVVSSIAFFAASLQARESIRVVDEAGQPVKGAKVTLVLPSSDRASAVFGHPRVVTETDQRGGLSFDLPLVEDGVVVVDHPRLAPQVIDLSDRSAPRASIVLREGARLRGQLSGDGEHPPGPGDVCAIWTVANFDGEGGVDIRRCAMVASDGAWILDALPSASMLLEVRVPMYLPLRSSISVPSEEWHGRLDAGLRTLVHVDDPRGRPAGGAIIECADAVPVVSDSLGKAWIAVPRSPSTCTASAPDGAVSISTVIQAPSTQPRVLHLELGRQVTGTLVTETGETVLMPRFFLIEEIADFGRSSVEVEPATFTAGTFRIRVPDGERRALRVEAHGSFPLTTEWFAPSPGESAELGLLVVRRGAGIRGQILAAQTGQPLGGAVVRLEVLGAARIVFGRLGRASTVTDADGWFTVSGLLPASYRVRIERSTTPPAEFVVDLFREEIVSVGTIGLHPGVRVSGKAQSRDGSPLPGSRIELVPPGVPDGEALVSTYTNTDGTFGPILAAPGSYRLLLRAPDLIWDQEIEIPADHDTERLDLRMRSTRLTVLISERGTAVSGGEVVLQRAADRSGGMGVAVARNRRSDEQLWSGKGESPITGVVDSRGMLVLDDAPAGRMVIDYFGPSGERGTRILDIPDDREAVLTIDVGGWDLRGRVLDAQTEAGLAGTVELLDGDGVSMARGSSAQLGEFVIPNVQPGKYRLTANIEGYKMSAADVSISNEAPPPAEIRLTRAAEARLDLELRRDAVAPASGVSVAIVDSSGRRLRALPTLIDGKLHLPGMAEGTVHAIWADPLAGVGVSQPLSLRSGQQDVTLNLVPGKDVVLRCEGRDCAGASLGWIKITDKSGIDLAPFLIRSGAVVYSESGRAHIGRLAPGRYEFIVVSGSFRFQEFVEVGGGPGEVELYLQRR